MSQSNPFKWRQFEAEIILLCVRWYLRYALSYRDLEEMMLERGLSVDHTTIFRWAQRYAPELEKRCRPSLQLTNDSYRVDETYIGALPAACTLRPMPYLNNIIEQDHRFVKRIARYRLGFGSFRTAWRTLRGFEVMNMIRKGQLQGAGRGDIIAQNRIIAILFGITV